MTTCDEKITGVPVSQMISSCYFYIKLDLGMAKNRLPTKSCWTNLQRLSDTVTAFTDPEGLIRELRKKTDYHTGNTSQPSVGSLHGSQ